MLFQERVTLQMSSQKLVSTLFPLTGLGSNLLLPHLGNLTYPLMFMSAKSVSVYGFEEYLGEFLAIRRSA